MIHGFARVTRLCDECDGVIHVGSVTVVSVMKACNVMVAMAVVLRCMRSGN